MFRLCLWMVSALSLVIPAGQARADFLIFDLGARDDWFTAWGLKRPAEMNDIDGVFVLSGSAVVAPSQMIVFRKERNGPQVYFHLGEVKFVKAPTLDQEFNKRMRQAGKDPGACMQAGIWALKRGMLLDSYKAADKARDIDPAHPAASLVAELRQAMKPTLTDDSEAEQKLRSSVSRDGMRIVQSKHFLLLTDTDAEPPKGRAKSCAHERLDLLEKCYETFLLLFHSQNISLDIPREKLPIVLFKNQADFLDAAKRIKPALAGESGFWDPVGNVCYFHNGAGQRIDLLAKLRERIKTIRETDAKRARDPELIRHSKVLEFLAETERESCDMKAVSREICNQIAAPTGLLPRDTTVPRWVREGMATYFETPAGAAWAGIGAVTEWRLSSYRELAWRDLSRSNIDFIVADKIFASAQKPEDQRAAVGQAWALTHFLVENHFAELAAFYRLLAKRPKDARPDPEMTKKLFSQALEKDRKALDLEWHSYMDSLKTELQTYQLESDKELLQQRLNNKR